MISQTEREERELYIRKNCNHTGFCMGAVLYKSGKKNKEDLENGCVRCGYYKLNDGNPKSVFRYIKSYLGKIFSPDEEHIAQNPKQRRF